MKRWGETIANINHKIIVVERFLPIQLKVHDQPLILRLRLEHDQLCNMDNATYDQVCLIMYTILTVKTDDEMLHK